MRKEEEAAFARRQSTEPDSVHDLGHGHDSNKCLVEVTKDILKTKVASLKAMLVHEKAISDRFQALSDK